MESQRKVHSAGFKPRLPWRPTKARRQRPQDLRTSKGRPRRLQGRGWDAGHRPKLDPRCRQDRSRDQSREGPPPLVCVLATRLGRAGVTPAPKAVFASPGLAILRILKAPRRIVHLPGLPVEYNSCMKDVMPSEISRMSSIRCATCGVSFAEERDKLLDSSKRIASGSGAQAPLRNVRLTYLLAPTTCDRRGRSSRRTLAAQCVFTPTHPPSI
jgi:hypothetical protein